MNVKVCIECEQEFERPTGLSNPKWHQRKYCDLTCRYEYQRRMCINGHEKTPENTAVRSSGKKYCRQCHNKDSTKSAGVKWVCGHPKNSKNTKKERNRTRCRLCFQANQHKRYEIYGNIRQQAERKDRTRPENTPVSHDWRGRGACQSEPDAFFPDRSNMEGIAKAKALCSACPVKKLCLAEGVSEGYGVWGGASENDRARYRLGWISYEELEDLATVVTVATPAEEVVRVKQLKKTCQYGHNEWVMRSGKRCCAACARRRVRESRARQRAVA